MLPAGGRHVIDNRSFRTGLTIGADVTQTLSRRMRLFVPVRVTLFRGDVPQHWAGEYDIQIGAGVRFGVFRRVS